MADKLTLTIKGRNFTIDWPYDRDPTGDEISAISKSIYAKEFGNAPTKPAKALPSIQQALSQYNTMPRVFGGIGDAPNTLTPTLSGGLFGQQQPQPTSIPADPKVRAKRARQDAEAISKFQNELSGAPLIMGGLGKTTPEKILAEQDRAARQASTEARVAMTDPHTLEGAMAEYDRRFPDVATKNPKERDRVKFAIQRRLKNPWVQNSIKNGETAFNAAFMHGKWEDTRERMIAEDQRYDGTEAWVYGTGNKRLIQDMLRHQDYTNSEARKHDTSPMGWMSDPVEWQGLADEVKSSLTMTGQMFGQFPRALGAYAAGATDKIGQLTLGETPGWFKEQHPDWMERQQEAVNFASYFIPYLGQAHLLADAGAMGGRAVEVGPTEAAREFLNGAWESVRFWDPNIPAEQRFFRGMNALMLGLGATHGSIQAYKGGNRALLANELSGKLKISRIEAYDLIKRSEQFTRTQIYGAPKTTPYIKRDYSDTPTTAAFSEQQRVKQPTKQAVRPATPGGFKPGEIASQRGVNPPQQPVSLPDVGNPVGDLTSLTRRPEVPYEPQISRAEPVVTKPKPKGKGDYPDPSVNGPFPDGDVEPSLGMLNRLYDKGGPHHDVLNALHEAYEHGVDITPYEDLATRIGAARLSPKQQMEAFSFLAGNDVLDPKLIDRALAEFKTDKNIHFTDPDGQIDIYSPQTKHGGESTAHGRLEAIVNESNKLRNGKAVVGDSSPTVPGDKATKPTAAPKAKSQPAPTPESAKAEPPAIIEQTHSEAAPEPGETVIKGSIDERNSVIARKGRASAKTRLTPAQTEFMGDKLKEAYEMLPEEGEHKAGVTVDVPGDGKFTVHTRAQAEKLNKAFGGKPIVEKEPLPPKIGIGQQRDSFVHGELDGRPVAGTTSVVFLDEPDLHTAIKANEGKSHKINVGKPDPAKLKEAFDTAGGGDVLKPHHTDAKNKILYLKDSKGNTVAIRKDVADEIYKRGYTIENAKQDGKYLRIVDEHGETKGITAKATDGEMAKADPTQTLPYKAPRKRKPAGGGESESMSLRTSSNAMPPTGGTKTPKGGRVEPDPVPSTKSLTQYQVVDYIAKQLNHLIMVGKPRARRALGTYSPTDTAVISKGHGNIDVALHETAGHLLDDMYGIGKQWHQPRAKSPYDVELFQPEFQHTTTRRMALRDRRAEAIAEWFTAYVKNPDEARRLAPNFTKYVEGKLPAEVLAKLADISNKVREWAGNPDKIGGVIDGNGPKERWERLKAVFTPAGLKREFTDVLDPLVKATETILQRRGMTQILPMNDPRILADMMAFVDRRVEYMIKNGIHDAQGNKITEGFGSILKPLDNTNTKTLKAEIGDLNRMMIAERVIELDARGLQGAANLGGGIYNSVAIARQALAELRKDTAKWNRLQDAANAYRDIADGLLRYARDRGRISQADYLRISQANDYYVAMQRVMEDPIGNWHGGGLGSVKNPIRKIKGSSRQIKDPLASLLEQAATIIREADRNNVMVQLTDLVRMPPRGLHRGPAPVDLTDIMRLAKSGEKNTILVYRKGVAERWQVNDPLLLETLKGVGNNHASMGPVLDLVGRVVQIPFKVIRATATSTPAFAVRNIIRDAFDRYVKSRVDSKFTDMFKRMTPLENEIFELYGGGMGRSEYDIYAANFYKAQKRLIEHTAKSKGAARTAFMFSRNMVEKYAELIEMSERVGRAAELRAAYRYAKNKLGYDELNAQLYAASESRNINPFHRAGRVLRVINKLIPFSNANVQALSRLGTRIKENPGKTAARYLLSTGAVTAAVRAYYATLPEDVQERMRQRSPDRKMMFWTIPIGPDMDLDIPMSHEQGLPVYMLNAAIDMAQGDEHAFDGAANQLWQKVPVLPNALDWDGPLGPLGQVAKNYDTFRDRPIVPHFEERLAVEMREGTEHATEFGKGFAKVLGGDVDPRQVDAWIEKQFSGWGKIVLRMTDKGTAQRATTAQTLRLLTGVVAGEPGYDARDVQWVMESVAKAGARNNPLKEATQAVFDAKSDQARHEAKRVLIDQAKLWRKTLEANTRGLDGKQKWEMMRDVLNRG